MTTDIRSHGFTALGPLHEGFARLTGLKAAGVAILLGAFSAVAFAPFHVSAVLIISFTGLVWMLDGARGQRNWGRATFMRGWAFGVGYFLVSMHWTAAPFLIDPAKHIWFIWMPLVLLPAGMALIWGAFMAMAAAFWSASPSRVFIFAVFFTLAEFVRGHLFGGFPWNLAGTTWMPGGAVSQLASLIGVYGLTLLTVFVMAAFAALVDTRDARGLVLRVTPAAVALIGFALAWSWGGQRLTAPAQMTTQTVTLLDAGVPQTDIATAGPAAIFQRYLTLMKADPGKPGDIVIWPEGAVPAYLLQDPYAMDDISAVLGDRVLIFGTARYQIGAKGKDEYFNTLAMIDQTANRAGPIAIYDKHRLVPFGELPASRIIPFGEAIAGILPPAMQQMASDGFHPGAGPAVIDYVGVAPPFVAMICYEGLFPAVARQANMMARADWMVLISEDGWFGPSMGPAQHYAQNRYRAIESGVPMVRVASRGVSAIVDPMGREIVRAAAMDGTSAPATPGSAALLSGELTTELATRPGWKTKAAKGTLPAPLARTLYQTRAGSVLFWAGMAIFILLAFVTWRR